MPAYAQDSLQLCYRSKVPVITPRQYTRPTLQYLWTISNGIPSSSWNTRFDM